MVAGRTSAVIKRTLAALCLLAILLLHRFLAYPAVAALDCLVQTSIHAHANPALTLAAKAFSFIGAPSTLWPTVAIAALILRLRRRRRPALLLAAVMFPAGALETLIKLLYRRPRPPLPWAYVQEQTFSFPSGHATLAIALYGLLIVLSLRRPPWQRAATLAAGILLTAAIGLSRIYLGAHYPTDVLAGYLTGAAALSLVLSIVHPDKPETDTALVETATPQTR